MTAAEYFAAVGAILQATATTTSTYPNAATDDPAYPAGHITAMVEAAAKEVLGLIASTPAHPNRQGLLATQSGVANNTLLVDAYGPITGVRVTSATAVTRYADETDPRLVQDRITNPESLELEVFFYGVDGDRLYHTGATAAYDYVPLSISTAVTDVPEQYENAVIAIALSYLFPVEGSNVQVAGHFAGLAESARRDVRAAAAVSRPVPPAEG